MMSSRTEVASGQAFGSCAVRLLGVMALVAGWSPDNFWNATPADVRAVLAGWVEAGGDSGFDGAALAALMEQFPDGRD